MNSWKGIPLPAVALLAVALLSLVAGLVALQLHGSPVGAGFFLSTWYLATAITWSHQLSIIPNLSQQDGGDS